MEFFISEVINKAVIFHSPIYRVLCLVLDA